MAGLDLTLLDPMLKDHYASGVVENLAYANNRGLAWISKSNKKLAGGRKWVQPIGIALPGGGSSTFATANAADNPSLHDAFEVTRAKHYRVARIDNETIEATVTGNEDAFESALEEFDKAIEAEANWINHRFFRSKGGAVGKMNNSTVTTTVITLNDPADVWQVRKGDVLKLASTDGTSGSLRTGSLTVASINRKAGTITCTANIDTGITSPAVGDYIFLDGDFGASPAGLADWVPDTTPTTSLFSVDRTVEPDLLGGFRVDATSTGQTIYETIIDLVVEYDNVGGPSNELTLFINPRKAGTLTKQIEGKWVVQQASGNGGKKIASIGYQSWQINVEGRTVNVVTERSCPTKRLYLLDQSTWTMFHAGPVPGFLTKRAGSYIKVSESYDGYEARIGEYFNFACKAPGWNGVALID